MSKAFPEPEPIPEGHAWAETRDLFPEDRRLRAARFRIHARRGRREPVWERDGQLYTHAAALASLREGAA